MIRHSVSAIALTAAFASIFSPGCQREQHSFTSTLSNDSATTNDSTTVAPTPQSKNPITVYSGRSEKLIGPILKRFSDQTGIKVDVRYGESAEMAATILEEGSRTPSDVFISQDAAALGAVVEAGLSKALPADITSRVPARFADSKSRWVGLSGRARTIVYNPGRMTSTQLPQTLEAFGDAKYRGKFGIAPANASFQAHLAVYNAVKGEAALKKLVDSMVANKPRRYPKNDAIVRAVAAGEIDFGLVNHYYLWQAKKQNPAIKAANFIMSGGDASSFVNLAGATVLSEQPEAVELVRYLLGDESQRYFAQETYEYPLVNGIAATTDLTPLAQLRTPELDFGKVSAVLPKTLEIINTSGLARE